MVLFLLSNATSILHLRKFFMLPAGNSPPTVCACGEKFTVMHPWACRKGEVVKAKDACHDAIKSCLYVEMQGITGMNCKMEPKNLDKDSSKRPDLIIELDDQVILTDIKTINPMCPSYFNAKNYQAAMQSAALMKTRKYQTLVDELSAKFVPMVISSYGNFHPEFWNFIEKITINTGLSYKSSGMKTTTRDKLVDKILIQMAVGSAQITKICYNLACAEAIEQAKRNFNPWSSEITVK